MVAGQTVGREDRLSSALARLRANGERVTSARRAVLCILADTEEHLSADDLTARVAVLAPTVHRATVYRTLDSLTRSGILAYVHLPHGAATYHLGDAEHRIHLHLMCRSCDQVTDVPADLLDEVSSQLKRSLDFELDPEHVALTGWCRHCKPD